MSVKGWIEANNYKGGIIRYLYDKIVSMDSGDSTVAGKVTALETTVGDSGSGLVKTVGDHTTAIGKASGEGAGGILKDVADMKTAIGDESTEGTILARIKVLEDAE